MPSRKSGLKHMKADEKKRVRNARVKSSLKTHIKKFERLITAGKIDEAKAFLPRLASALDKAAKRKIIHKNKADRQKSRLTGKAKT